MNKDWIKWEWTAEKPYPETLDAIVLVRFGYDPEWIDVHPRPVSHWGWTGIPSDKHPDDITHYRLA